MCIYIHTHIYTNIYTTHTHTPPISPLSVHLWRDTEVFPCPGLVNCAAANTGAHCTCLFEPRFSRGLRPGGDAACHRPEQFGPVRGNNTPATKALAGVRCFPPPPAVSWLCVSSCIQYGFSVSRQISVFDHPRSPGGTRRFREIKKPAPNHTTQRGLGRM